MMNDGISPSIESVQQLCREVRDNVARVIIGKSDVIDLLLVALLSNGLKMCQGWAKQSWRRR